MKNTEAIKQNRDFRSLYRRGGSAVSRCLVIYTRRNRLSANRLGLTASKKVGNAVVRNRIRRLIKENYRLREDNIKIGNDIVFVARTRAANASYAEIGKDMDYLLEKCKLKNENTLH